MPKLKTKKLGPRVADTLAVKPMPKTVDRAYTDPRHKQWRTQVMTNAGWCCQHPSCNRRAPAHRLYADHIVELKDGGAPFDPANGQALCARHHSQKTAQARAARHKGGHPKSTA